MSTPLATVGIISIGEMGLGIGKLLVAHKYRVVTNVTGRSEDTHARARSGQIEMLASDADLVQASDYILSIVPPRDSLATAQRVVNALQASSTPRKHPVYYLDLNAISPRSAREVFNLFQDPASALAIDGGIIGGAPRAKNDTTPSTNVAQNQVSGGLNWTRPSIPVSGPHKLSSAPVSGNHLAETLNIRHISDVIGPASGLKMCFATTTKGATALAIQAFTTASQLGVLDELKAEMGAMNPGALKSAEKGLPSMAPKAYRWVREMEEIADTHAEEGGFDRQVFNGIAQIYKSVAEDTVLGEEKTERRKRGRTAEDVAIAIGEGLQAKKKKSD